MLTSKPELLGLVLAGGESLRMGRDKGLLVYEQLSPLAQRVRATRLLEECGLTTYLSCRQKNHDTANVKVIYDQPQFDFENHAGPGIGILSAHLFKPEAAWLVLACDFPFADIQSIDYLIQQRHAEGRPTAYQHFDETTEPLFTIWEPETLVEFLRVYRDGYQSPRRTLEKENVYLVKPNHAKILVNINSPVEAQHFSELQ